MHTNHLLRPGYPSPRDRSSGWTGLSFGYFSVALLQKNSLLYANTLKLKRKPGSEFHGEKCTKRQPHHRFVSDIERLNPTGKMTVDRTGKPRSAVLGLCRSQNREDSPGKHTKMGSSAKSHNQTIYSYRNSFHQGLGCW